jgi:hypothetical protein
MNDPCYDIGGGVPPIGIKVKDPMLYKWCHSNTYSGVHKKCKIQVSIIYLNATLCIKRYTPFMKIHDKGAEISTKILREVGFGHKYGQRRSNIEECERIKNSWTREARK